MRRARREVRLIAHGALADLEPDGGGLAHILGHAQAPPALVLTRPFHGAGRVFEPSLRYRLDESASFFPRHRALTFA